MEVYHSTDGNVEMVQRRHNGLGWKSGVRRFEKLLGLWLTTLHRTITLFCSLNNGNDVDEIEPPRNFTNHLSFRGVRTDHVEKEPLKTGPSQ